VLGLSGVELIEGAPQAIQVIRDINIIPRLKARYLELLRNRHVFSSFRSRIPNTGLHASEAWGF
jgi:hypothetical protein